MHTKDGFSLVEIIVATIVLSLTILGLLGVFVAGNNWVIHFRERSTSAELGKFFVDPLQMDVRQDTWGPNPLSRPTTTQTINGKIFTAEYTPSNVPGTVLRKVSTTINWTEGATVP